jgi:hypothetical protein
LSGTTVPQCDSQDSGNKSDDPWLLLCYTFPANATTRAHSRSRLHDGGLLFHGPLAARVPRVRLAKQQLVWKRGKEVVLAVSAFDGLQISVEILPSDGGEMHLGLAFRQRT